MTYFLRFSVEAGGIITFIPPGSNISGSMPQAPNNKLLGVLPHLHWSGLPTNFKDFQKYNLLTLIGCWRQSCSTVSHQKARMQVRGLI